MNRFLCVHGHFYQPPRENPWTGRIEREESAAPYENWNERITAECYEPNAFPRVPDASGKLVELPGNYAKMSFNFGPTLLEWLAEKAPRVYGAILSADKESGERFSGHGSAMAQAYNHMILPLASRGDKRTQVLWGIRDFEHRFGRFPEGMWLPETAVDAETLETLAESGIRFTILAPHQANRVRAIGEETWQEVSAGSIDTTRPYAARLPSGRRIAIFFYEGPSAHAVAFGELQKGGESLALRLAGLFSETEEPQLVSIATDGETYGHHHQGGEAAFATALELTESRGLARLTNYGQFLAEHPPTYEVSIRENTAWSCAHGLGRWSEDCGCRTELHPEWNQTWRRPLREALDWLSGRLGERYEERASQLFRDPWQARDESILLRLDPSPRGLETFLGRQARRRLSEEEKSAAVRLLEVERYAMLMFTSCGWFFDDVSGLESRQVLRYAGRAIELAESAFGESFEAAFLSRLEQVRSNARDFRHARDVYAEFVAPYLAGAAAPRR
ncbi:MAG: DUF3536 domain-containing protein [Thermoanaerobaculia bacterium]